MKMVLGQAALGVGVDDFVSSFWQFRSRSAFWRRPPPWKGSLRRRCSCDRSRPVPLWLASRSCRQARPSGQTNYCYWIRVGRRLIHAERPRTRTRSCLNRPGESGDSVPVQAPGMAVDTLKKVMGGS